MIGDAAFVGETLFMPDGGTARADFLGGDARTLYRSDHRVLELPPEPRLSMCHDYAPDGRGIRWETDGRRYLKVPVEGIDDKHDAGAAK